MKPLFSSIAKCVVVAAIVSGLAAAAAAADVRAGLSTRETYVGLPVTLQIQISNATKFDPPTVPTGDGLNVKSLGTPSRSTHVMSINGNTTTTSTVIYAYQITPLQPGTYRIPPITVHADGRDLATRPLEFVASKSETGDLLCVEIAGKEKQIYVGQSLDLTLKVWVRPYHDKERNLTLSEGDMWQLISNRSTWGGFASRIEEMAKNDQRPAGRKVLRKDRDGVEQSYYLYEIDATIYPKRPGKIDANDVRIVVDYPTALGQSRDPFASFFDDMQMPGGRAGSMFGNDDFFAPFGSRLTVESVRPIVAEAEVDPIDVLPIPTADRPADYRGAVGKYHIVTEATPSNVKAGDPINLLIGIAGTGPMEFVQAPPLEDLPELTRDFKVPSGPLAGFVKGDQKVFSTTIRPRKAGVAEIPAIPLSFFDPETSKFVTVHSKPISIHVEPADTLALDDVVGRSKSAAAGSAGSASSDAAAASPQLAIFTGDDLLANQSRLEPISRTFAMLLAVPPLAVLALVIARGRGGFVALAGRLRSGMRKCRTQIETAEQPIEVGDSLRTLFVRRFGLSRSADAAAVVGALRSAGYRNIAVSCERILHQCDHPFVGGRGSDLNELKQDALQLIDDLGSQRRPTVVRNARTRPQARRTPTAVALALVLSGALFVADGNAQAATIATPAAVGAAKATLTAQQQQSLLAEANERYNQALATAANDSAEAKQGFAEAAEKYQLLIDSGVRNSRLYFNAANAYLQSGASGRAIANYRRSLALDPTNSACRTNLAFAENRIAPAGASSDSGPAANSFTDYLSLANGWLNRAANPQEVLAVAVTAWLVLWATVALRIAHIRLPWKSLASVSLVVAALAAASYALSCQAAARQEAIVVHGDAPLRTGDGGNFPRVASAPLKEGQSVEWLHRRGDWIQVRTDQGQSGWLPNTAVEIL